MATVDNLRSLAMIDEEIKEIESSRGDLPSRIEKLEIEKKSTESEIQNLNNKINELSDSQVELNKNKEENDLNLGKYKDQLYLVKNNKEYDALNTEIDVVKNNLSQISGELSAINENKKSIEEDVKLKQTHIEECSEKLDKYSSLLKSLMNDKEKEYKNLSLQKEKLIGNMDNEILAKYNIMLAAKGYGAAAVMGDACEACYTTLPTQLVSEIKQKTEFKYCPSCTILLYFGE